MATVFPPPTSPRMLCGSGFSEIIEHYIRHNRLVLWVYFPALTLTEGWSEDVCDSLEEV